MKIEGITTRNELDIVEAENILEAFLKYTLSPEQIKDVIFDTQFLEQLHKVLSRYSNKTTLLIGQDTPFSQWKWKMWQAFYGFMASLYW